MFLRPISAPYFNPRSVFTRSELRHEHNIAFQLSLGVMTAGNDIGELGVQRLRVVLSQEVVQLNSSLCAITRVTRPFNQAHCAFSQ